MTIFETMLEASLVRTKNIALYAISGIMYWIFGYNLMYSGVDGGFIGSLSRAYSFDPVGLINEKRHARSMIRLAIDMAYSRPDGGRHHQKAHTKHQGTPCYKSHKFNRIQLCHCASPS